MFTTKNQMHSKNAFTKFAVIVFSIIMLTSSFPLTPADAQTRDCLTDTVTRVDADYNGPVFLDAYWTDRSSTVENELNPTELVVGPGEGQSTLAVVFVNRSPLELYAVTGYLRLPDGFIPGGTSADPEAKAYFESRISKNSQDVSQASYFDELEEGEVFTLYFDVEITDEAVVGSYRGQAILDYSTPDYVRSCKSALLTVPFILPGKVILDLTTDNIPLTPKIANEVEFFILNKGSVDATGAVLRISNIGESTDSGGSGQTVVTDTIETELVNLGDNTFNIGTIPANSNVTVSTNIFPEATAGSTVQNISFEIEYINAYGYQQTETLTTGLVVSPKPSESPIIISVDTVHEQAVVTAGMVENIKFEITNSGYGDISDLLVTLSGESAEMEIMGKSKWVIESLLIGETVDISTDVFASTSLINNPSSFTLELDYISDGESNVETSDVGVFVAGKIDLELYDVQINNIGGRLYVVGNILNQGSTTGKFANIELIDFPDLPTNQTSNLNTSDLPQQTQGQFPTDGSFGSGPPSDSFGSETLNNPNVADVSSNTGDSSVTPQYLGDLTDDSSIPFSIPLPFSSIPPGTYPFSFKVTYADDLRTFHDVVFDENISISQTIQQTQSSTNQNQSGFDFLSTEVIVGIIIAVVILIAIFYIRKNKSTSQPSEDLDFLLEDKSDPKIES
ncbi:MAG: hypothetical protein AABX32_01830 [Nanoarchaeota archaeon]